VKLTKLFGFLPWDVTTLGISCAIDFNVPVKFHGFHLKKFRKIRKLHLLASVLGGFCGTFHP